MKIRTEEGRTFFYFLLLAAFVVSYFLLQDYLATIVFSIVVVVMFKPAYDLFGKWFRGREMPTTLATVVLISLTVLIPLLVIINITVTQAIEFQQQLSTLGVGKNVNLTNVITHINRLLASIPYLDRYQLTEAEIVESVRGVVEPVATFLANKAVSIGSSSAEWVAKIIIFLSILAVLFPGYDRSIQLLKDLSPLDDQLDQRYIDRMTVMTKSMVKGVFIIAFVQGVVTGIFFWIAGVPYVLFFTLLAIFLSILPMGAQILAIPAGIVLLVMGDIWQGVVLIAGSVLVVGNLDNVLRPRLAPKETELNSALILLSAFGGLNLFGFLGIIYGPVIMIFLVTTIEIYLEYYRLDRPAVPEETPARPPRRRASRKKPPGKDE